ncbi:tRNA (guanosine(37)-N1)-methyltransferase TrmD [Nitrosophilus labii]|uniref:tRNA (guanosine(37)-N1)-methyltransferase TrmD n=1 Tax=Nitrosophilus labii TaxID=2706014 RepID=UPI001656C0C0|nr:tRNA (guanosine(37)-N1)-methyltransferase TrmD [Nitrosophilus labii]
MRFSFITLFRELMECYFQDSILKRAIEEELISIDFHNPRDYSKNRHKKVDAPKIGGGAGMLMTPQPLIDCIRDMKKEDSWVIFVTPAAKRFNQKDAKRLSQKRHLIFVSGRYEGIDERVIEKEADEVLSIGDFILTGGELAALCMTDAIARNIPGVLGNPDSLEEESFENSLLESPAFTKPNIFEGSFVPSEFLKGNHSKISALKKAMAIYRTNYYRPGLKA